MPRYDNYHSDPRVRAQDKWYSSLNEQKMTATVTVYDPEEDADIEYDVPVTFQVCDTCNGKGSHVNPSIDCNGLSREDFDEDPDFAEAYFEGQYDVPCYGCGGKRVTPEIDQDRIDPKVKGLLEEKEQCQREMRACEDAERRMGA
jgi:hypothetical protein